MRVGSFAWEAWERKTPRKPLTGEDYRLELEEEYLAFSLICLSAALVEVICVHCVGG